LEARNLLTVTKSSQTFTLALTDHGKQVASRLAKDQAFATLVEQMKRVKKTLGSRAGSGLKKLIYQIFEQEVVQRSLGETIE
jgi:hypothetical protein